MEGELAAPAEAVEREAHHLRVIPRRRPCVIVAAFNAGDETAADSLNSIGSRLVHGLFGVHVG